MRPGLYPKLIALLGLLIYAALLALVTVHHVPGFDEADAWLAARDLTLAQIFHFTGYVGNPPLWYLILMALTRLHAPYASMLWANFGIALAAASVLVLFAPFAKRTRILLILSYYVGYEYSVLARNYSLLMLALFATAALYRHRLRHPILFASAVGVLFHTTTHGAFFAAIVAGFVAWEIVRLGKIQKSYILAMVLMGASAVAAGWALWPPADSQRPGLFVMRYPHAIQDTLTRAIVVPFGSDLLEPVWLAFNLAVIAMAAAYLAQRPKFLAMFAVGYASLFYIFVFKWCAPARHAGLLTLWLVFVLWISWEEAISDRLIGALGSMGRRMVQIDRAVVLQALNVALFAASIQTLVAWDRELRVQSSHAKQIAKAIRRHGWDQQLIASNHFGESVLPYLNCRRFWNINTGQYLSHSRWDQNFNNNSWIPDSEIPQRIAAAFGRDHRPQILWNGWIAYANEMGYRLVFKTEGPVGPSGEVFYFYAPIAEQPATKPSPAPQPR